MLKLPCLAQATPFSLSQTHFPFLAVQGQSFWRIRPFSVYRMYSKAWEGRPPLQPWLSKLPAQSTSCCSAKIQFTPFLRMFQWDSMVPTVEKVQQEPQLPWFLTGVTTPFSVQSKCSGMFTSSFCSLSVCRLPVAEQCWGSMSRISLNSSKVRSARSLTPCVQEWPPRLCCRISMRFCTKTLQRYYEGVSKCWERNSPYIFRAVSWLNSSPPCKNSEYLALRCMLQTAKVTSSAIVRAFIICKIYQSYEVMASAFICLIQFYSPMERYYAPPVFRGRPLAFNQPWDRGKKHYWGERGKNYGLLTSHEEDQMQQHQRVTRHRRIKTDIKQQFTPYSNPQERYQTPVRNSSFKRNSSLHNQQLFQQSVDRSQTPMKLKVSNRAHTMGTERLDADPRLNEKWQKFLQRGSTNKLSSKNIDISLPRISRADSRIEDGSPVQYKEHKSSLRPSIFEVKSAQKREYSPTYCNSFAYPLSCYRYVQ